MSLQTISSINSKTIINQLSDFSYKTRYGKMINGDSLDILNILPDNSIDLVITSPPFALQRKKEYGNKEQYEYVEWLSLFAHLVFRKLKDTGSFVLDLGGAYKKGIPIRSLYNYRVLIKFCDEMGFNLAEEFFWFNPSKLPSPIEWVNKRKIRTKDSVNTIWWLSKTDWPKADVKNVLVPYSERMKKLLKNPNDFYKPKERPSGHSISDGFGIDNGGAIPSNLLRIPNSDSNSSYFRNCKKFKIKCHPARFPEKLPEFFIKFLTDPGDFIVDIFGGSNTTGYVAEMYQRNWLVIESNLEYVASSVFRFLDESINEIKIKDIYSSLICGEIVDINDYKIQKELF